MEAVLESKVLVLPAELRHMIWPTEKGEKKIQSLTSADSPEEAKETKHVIRITVNKWSFSVVLKRSQQEQSNISSQTCLCLILTV